MMLASWLRVDTARARRSGDGAPSRASTRGTCGAQGRVGGHGCREAAGDGPCLCVHAMPAGIFH